MIGPIASPLPLVASSAAEPAQAPLGLRAAEDPRAGTSVETARAAKPIPEDTGQRGIEGAIAARQTRIYQTESAAERDRARLERYPAEMQGLKAQLAGATDTEARTSLSERLTGLQNAYGATQKRVADFEANWPTQKAELQEQIADQQMRLAQIGYAQL